MAASARRRELSALIQRVNWITPRPVSHAEGMRPAFQLDTVSALNRAHPRESRGRKASGLRPDGHDSGAAKHADRAARLPAGAATFPRTGALCATDHRGES